MTIEIRLTFSSKLSLIFSPFFDESWTAYALLVRIGVKRTLVTNK